MPTPLTEAQSLLSRLTRAEKAQLLQWVVSDLGEAFPGIESKPGVCGGEPCTVSETGAANQAVPDMDGTHRGPGSPVAAITPEPAP